MKNKPLQAFAVISTLGLQFAFAVVLGFYLGSWLDEKLASGQLFVIIGVLAGVFAGFLGAYKLIKPFLEE